MDIDVTLLESPCYVTDERLLKKNLEILKDVSERSDCKILLAQKAFSMYSTYPLISRYLDGTTASGLFEARLGHEEMAGKQVHIFSPAYRPDEFPEIVRICDHIVFNSFSQWKRFKPVIDGELKKGGNIRCGIRVNPEYSEIKTAIYDPCAPDSRLGVRAEDFEENALEGISGLHFHTMCEQGSDVLERTVSHFEKKFGKYLHRMKWVNFGGGHHITREDYDREKLIDIIKYISGKYGVEVYLEPGEAVALNAGFLVSSVLEVYTSGGISHAIIDASAACHMPDVLEMPYRPNIIGSGRDGEKACTYRIGAATCLAGDSIGVYSFDAPLRAGDRLVFTDMAIYTMCKNNTFNGIGLPAIYLVDEQGSVCCRRKFGYEDFKGRL